MVKGVKKEFPLWQINLLFFALLLLVFNLSFFLHLKQIEKTFLKHSKDDALLVANIISLTTEVGYLSQKVLENTLSHFLGNISSFIDYLNSIEPFTYQELEAFLEENNLYGLVLKSQNSEIVVPEGWFDAEMAAKLSQASLLYLDDQDLFLFRKTENLKSLSEIIIAVRVENIAALKRSLSFEHLFEKLAQLPTILYVYLESDPVEDIVVQFKRQDVEVVLPFRGSALVVGLDAKRFIELKNRLRVHFFFILLFLLSFGALITFLFYRVQCEYVKRIKQYERDLSLRREEATLGRAAASIAHEIRNPLNTMSIALQRLLLEAPLSSEHRRLVELVLSSIRRTNNTVSSLLKYAKIPLNFDRSPLLLSQVIEDLLSLYQKEFQKLNISLDLHLDKELAIKGNKEFLFLALENLFRNALEAIDYGGTLKISLYRRDKKVYLVIANTGELPPPDAIDRIFEPYFTLKTQGTGLGLALVRKIVLAHGGKITAFVKDGMFHIEMVFEEAFDENTDR
ncbi:MAG: GHKL domain-containing protein [Thermodesulfobacteria bacterium]|nr:GHKL domain-containing protein [Thermodesulfobacteriota bacterium]